MNHYLALGDSYTIGEGVEAGGRWPLQLRKRLVARNVELEPPTIIAQTGWTTAELMAGIREAAPEGPFALVSLSIGVNNQYRGLPLEEYRAQFGELLALAAGLAGGESRKVLVLSIPDWGVTPFAKGRNRPAIAEDIDRFNAACREETGRVRARHVDVTAISRRHGDDANYLAPDGLHPSAPMYSEWAHAAEAEARQALGARR